jgi:hypothetical protein
LQRQIKRGSHRSIEELEMAISEVHCGTQPAAQAVRLDQVRRSDLGCYCQIRNLYAAGALASHFCLK